MPKKLEQCKFCEGRLTVKVFHIIKNKKTVKNPVWEITLCGFCKGKGRSNNKKYDEFIELQEYAKAERKNIKHKMA